MNLYNLRLFAPGHYQMAKFDSNFNVEAIYDLQAKGAGFTCSCPAGQRAVKLKPCKHQRALPYMLGALNTDRFYDIELRQWHTPLAPEIMANADVVGAALDHSEDPPAGEFKAPKGVDRVGAQERPSNAVITSEVAARVPVVAVTPPSSPIVTRRI